MLQIRASFFLSTESRSLKFTSSSLSYLHISNYQYIFLPFKTKVLESAAHTSLPSFLRIASSVSKGNKAFVLSLATKVSDDLSPF